MERLESWAVYQVAQEKQLAKKADAYLKLVGNTHGQKQTKQTDMLSLDLKGASHTYTLANQKPAAKQELEPAGGGQRRVCECCRGEVHYLAKCPKFLRADPTERKTFIKCTKRCFICLKKNHAAASCRYAEKCDQCGGSHHTLIHGADAKVNLVAVLLGVADSDLSLIHI